MNVPARQNRFVLAVGVLAIALFAACGDDDSSNNDTTDETDQSHGIDAAEQDFTCLGCDEGTGTECCEIDGQSFCISTASDFFHCGDCGLACDGLTANKCQASACRCGNSAPCTGSQECCGDVLGCKDLQSDVQNCGECGHACAANQTCTNGQCSCGGEVCGAGEECCGGTCKDVLADEQNCGSCGNTCTGLTDTCNNGDCACSTGGTQECPAPPGPLGPTQKLACCGTGCVDLCGDKNNCGSCGTVCGGIDFCFVGGCFLSGVPAPLPACQ